MAGAVFGEVGVSLFVAGAALGEILIDSRSAGARNVVFCHIKMRLQGGTRKVSEAAGARRRIILGLSSDGRRIVFILAGQFRDIPLKS